ncbi:Two-component system response regulator [hydrothermal vent metagenome]|uniref:Two-component system response regulator n=1 Tax=hydrothermal vent metagenome TaxID=652676 RepID=A0A3B0UMK3_9ZZZZ
MNCIILDHEPLSQNIIADYIEQVPFLKLKSKCTSAFQAYDILQNYKINLIFLDTRMPQVSGIDFIKSLEDKPMFIFTSAHTEDAIEGFNLNALDFLVKPVAFDRFLKASNKAYEYFNLKELKADKIRGRNEATLNSGFILVKSDYKTIKINLKDILYIEGLKDYIKIYTLTSNKPVITLNSLKNMEQTLPAEKFPRIHKSYIISLDHIKIINKAQVIIGETYIPIGESYKNYFLAEMENRRL